MNFRMSMDADWWKRTRSLRLIFLAGVVVGAVIGWLLHGVLSFVMRFGLVALLMLPLLAVAFMWWRSSQTRRRVETTSVARWESIDEGRPSFGRDDMSRHRVNGDVIDVTDARRVDHSSTHSS